MTTPTEQITVSPLTSVDDIPRMVAIEKAAFADFPLMQVVFGPRAPSTSDAASDQPSIDRHTNNFLSDPEVRYSLARLPSGEIIGWGKWYFWATAQNPFPKEFPEAGNAKLGHWVFGEFYRVMKEKMEERPFVYLHVLVVDPKYQRRGVGGLLCGWGLGEADGMGQEAYVDASPEGKGLYAKCGWEAIHELKVDLKEYGGPDVVSGCTNMWRPAKGKTV